MLQESQLLSLFCPARILLQQKKCPAHQNQFLSRGTPALPASQFSAFINVLSGGSLSQQGSAESIESRPQVALLPIQPLPNSQLLSMFCSATFLPLRRGAKSIESKFRISYRFCIPAGADCLNLFQRSSNPDIEDSVSVTPAAMVAVGGLSALWSRAIRNTN